MNWGTLKGPVVKPSPFVLPSQLTRDHQSPSQHTQNCSFWCWHATMPCNARWKMQLLSACSTVRIQHSLLIPGSTGMEICQHSTWHKWNKRASKDIKMQEITFYRLVRLLLAYFQTLLICMYVENPKYDCYNYTANLRSDKTITSDSVITAQLWKNPKLLSYILNYAIRDAAAFLDTRPSFYGSLFLWKLFVSGSGSKLMHRFSKWVLLYHRIVLVLLL